MGTLVLYQKTKDKSRRNSGLGRGRDQGSGVGGQGSGRSRFSALARKRGRKDGDWGPKESQALGYSLLVAGGVIQYWRKTRSRKWSNLKPTSRRWATHSKPKRSRKRREAVFSASTPAIMVCLPACSARRMSALRRSVPTPMPRESQ